MSEEDNKEHSPAFIKYHTFARILLDGESAIQTMKENRQYNKGTFVSSLRVDSFTAVLQELLTTARGEDPTVSGGFMRLGGYDSNGQYDNNTIYLLSLFQEENNIRITGIADKETVTKLIEVAMQKEKAQSNANDLPSSIAGLEYDKIPPFKEMKWESFGEGKTGVKLIDIQNALIRAGYGKDITPVELAVGADRGENKTGKWRGTDGVYLDSAHWQPCPQTLDALHRYIADHPEAKKTVGTFSTVDVFCKELVTSLNAAAKEPEKDKEAVKARKAAAAAKPTPDAGAGILAAVGSAYEWLAKKGDEALNYGPTWMEHEGTVKDTARMLQVINDKDGKPFLDKDINLDRLTVKQYPQIKDALKAFQHHFFDDDKGTLTKGIVAGDLDKVTWTKLLEQSRTVLEKVKQEELEKAAQAEKEKAAKAKEEEEKKKAEKEAKDKLEAEQKNTEKKETPTAGVGNPPDTGSAPKTEATPKTETAPKTDKPAASGELTREQREQALKERVAALGAELEKNILPERQKLLAQSGVEQSGAGANANNPSPNAGNNANTPPAANKNQNAQLSPVMVEIERMLQNIFQMLSAALGQLSQTINANRDPVANNRTPNQNAPAAANPTVDGVQMTADKKYVLVPTEDYKNIISALNNGDKAMERSEKAIHRSEANLTAQLNKSTMAIQHDTVWRHNGDAIMPSMTGVRGGAVTQQKLS